MIKTFLDKNNIDAHFDESMKKHTTFKVGGNAMCIAMPDSIEKAANLIEFLKNNNIESYYLGNGSNVIFNDNGFNGVIVKSLNLNNINIDGTTVKVGAGMLMTSLSKAVREKGLSGLEFCIFFSAA